MLARDVFSEDALLDISEVFRNGVGLCHVDIQFAFCTLDFVSGVLDMLLVALEPFFVDGLLLVEGFVLCNDSAAGESLGTKRIAELD